MKMTFSIRIIELPGELTQSCFDQDTRPIFMRKIIGKVNPKKLKAPTHLKERLKVNSYANPSKARQSLKEMVSDLSES